MTIKEKDFRPSAQVRPEIVELADRLLGLGGVRDDESFSYVRVGLIYRNQGWRECLLTHRVTQQNYLKCRDENKPYNDTYATYQMPNGKVYKVAVDIGRECAIYETLRITTFDLDEHIGIPYNTLYPELLENVGKYLIITDDLGTLSDHQNYDGSPIKIDSVSPDGYYLCGGYVVDAGECEIVD